MLRSFAYWIFALGLSTLIAPAAEAGELRHEQFASPVLGRTLNALVYVPDGYDAGNDRFPVLYLLHGSGDNENTWEDRGHIKEKADALIKRGAIPRALIVMPGCRACWWVDGASENVETAFWKDLVPEIDRRFRTIQSREGRLVAGLSAGGYGAIRFAMRYPDRISAVAAMSPAIYADTPPLNSSARRSPQFQSEGGQFSQKLWEGQNYPNLIGTYFSQPVRIPFFLVSGDGDTLGIAFETALLFKRLFEKQSDRVELRIVDGDHSWKVWDTVMDDAITYVFRYSARPQSSTKTAKIQSGELPASSKTQS